MFGLRFAIPRVSCGFRLAEFAFGLAFGFVFASGGVSILSSVCVVADKAAGAVIGRLAACVKPRYVRCASIALGLLMIPI